MNALFLAAALAASSPVPDPVPPAALPAAMEQLGLRLDMDYAQARRLLLAEGWIAQPHDYEGRPPLEAHPELDCGNGWHAVCTVGYARNGQTLFLTLDPKADDRLTVIGVD